MADQFPSDVPVEPRLVSMTREGHLVRLCIERPEVMNCLSFPTLRRFRTLLEELKGDLTIRCILITGAGEQPSAPAPTSRSARPCSRARADFVRNIRALMDDVAAMPQPTVAVVQGFAFGGGIELMLACDLRVAAEEAMFGLTETTLAIIPGAGGTSACPGSSEPAAPRTSSSPAQIGAGEAERIGLVNRVAPRSRWTTPRELVETIAGNGPVAVRAAKEAIDVGTEAPMGGLEIEARCYEKVLPTTDRLEALAAFAEKRKPEYRGSDPGGGGPGSFPRRPGWRPGIGRVRGSRFLAAPALHGSSYQSSVALAIASTVSAPWSAPPDPAVALISSVQVFWSRLMSQKGQVRHWTGLTG